MRLNSPRIAPLLDAELTQQQRAILAPLSVNAPAHNIFRTLARAPEALSAFLTWGGYILSRKRNSLPEREREIVILRIGYLCRSGYEWTQHVEIAKRAGLTNLEIAQIKTGLGFAPAETALIKACDELHAGQFISDAVWAELKTHFTDKQCMDLVFTAGQYTQVSMMLNSFGVQLDQGQSLDPDLRA